MLTKSEGGEDAKISVFNQVSLESYFTDANGDMSWAHRDSNDSDWQSFVEGNASGGGELMFGRIRMK